MIIDPDGRALRDTGAFWHPTSVVDANHAPCPGDTSVMIAPSDQQQVKSSIKQQKAG